VTPVRKAALRLEMAEGRVQAITTGRGGDPAVLDEAVFDRDSERNRFHEALREAAGMDPQTIARILAL
jgi:hypothetical protein